MFHQTINYIYTNYLDVKERFMHYRRDVGDTILNTYYILRNQMLAFLVELAISQINTPGRNPNQWQVLSIEMLSLRLDYRKY
jgi:hypothetical protein